jgi:hypothetical protein
MGTPEGTVALTLASRCDTFAQADKLLKAAFNAGRKTLAVNCSAFGGKCWRDPACTDQCKNRGETPVTNSTEGK